MRIAGVVLLTLLLACGGGSQGKKGGTTAKDGKRKVKIVDGGQIYDALNTTDCVKWPSDAIKKKAGYLAWGRYYPGTGEVGEVIATLDHCDKKTKVVLVMIGDHVVPVTSKGVVDATAEDLKAIADAGGMLGVGLGGDEYGGYGIGGYGYGYGGDEYGYGYDDGYDGYDYGGVAGGAVGFRFVVGDAVTIVDDGQTYPSLNEVENCVAWPSDDVKKKAGEAAWGGWTTSNGMTGTVLYLVTNCDGSDTPLAIVEIEGHLVTIAESGLDYQ